MSTATDIDFIPILQNVGKHIQLTPQEITLFTSLLKAKQVRKGHFLIEAGDQAGFMCYVVQGCLRSYSIDEKGNEHVLQFAPEDWWTGDLASFVKGTTATIYSDALEDSAVLRLDRKDMEDLYARIPKFERFFRILITNAFIATQRRLLSTISHPAEERYVEFIALYPDLDGRVPQKHIASYLGMTPEFLSTVRKRARASGKVKKG
jgi:CRP-like cAMP-binding protein